jgi:hypothetical protein
MRRLVIVGVIGLILLISACGKNKTENPAPVDTVVENSIGVWSVQDIRSVAQNLVRDMLQRIGSAVTKKRTCANRS